MNKRKYGARHLISSQVYKFAFASFSIKDRVLGALENSKHPHISTDTQMERDVCVY